MMLLTKQIKKEAEKQYAIGADITAQKIVAKFFDPTGSWTWYLMNIDPADNSYAWGIVKGFEVEQGSFSLDELKAYRGRFGLGIERDISFHAMPASEVWEKLQNGIHV